MRNLLDMQEYPGRNADSQFDDAFRGAWHAGTRQGDGSDRTRPGSLVLRRPMGPQGRAFDPLESDSAKFLATVGHCFMSMPTEICHRAHARCLGEIWI